MPGLQPLANLPAVGYGAQGEDSRQINSWKRWPDWSCSRSEQQCVIAFAPNLPGGEIADFDFLRGKVEFCRLVSRANLNVEPFSEQFRRRHQKFMLILDHVAHVIREAAVANDT